MEEEKNKTWVDYFKELPRPFACVAFVVTLCVGFFMGKVEVDTIKALAAICLTWYFCERAIGKKQGS